MPRNGTGTFNLAPGNPVVNGTNIDPNWANTTLADIANGLTQSIANNGQTPIVADLPMAGHKFTGVSDATARNQFPSVGQIQDGVFLKLVSVAGADTITSAAFPAITAYADGQTFSFVPAGNNTGACTLNISSVGASPIKMLDGTDPPAGALNSNGVAVVQRKAPNFVLLNPATRITQQTIALDTNFTSGNAILITEKTPSGKTVTLVIPTQATHISSATPVTSAIIPIGSRPSVVFHAGSGIPGANMQNLIISADGTIRVTYEAARTQMFAATSATYYIAD